MKADEANNHPNSPENNAKAAVVFALFCIAAGITLSSAVPGELVSLFPFGIAAASLVFALKALATRSD